VGAAFGQTAVGAAFRRPARTVVASQVVLRAATASDADAIQALIAEPVADGHLLPRTVEEIAAHAQRFVVATAGDRILGCADMAPLSSAVGEVRSLVISDDARGLGVGRRLLDHLVARATATGLRTVCAFTSAPGFFLQMGFSIVPHTWLPEKIQADCAGCARFRSCGQFAVMRSLETPCRH
jgi:amino-acid N-acetyltransferase